MLHSWRHTVSRSCWYHIIMPQISRVALFTNFISPILAELQLRDGGILICWVHCRHEQEIKALLIGQFPSEFTWHHQHDSWVSSLLILLHHFWQYQIYIVTNSRHTCMNIALLVLMNWNGFVPFLDQYLWKDDGFIDNLCHMLLDYVG